MECWDKMMTPMRKVWTKVSKRIGLRKTGIVKLKQDVRTCEYEDVHILWDMLKRKETHMSADTIRKGPFSEFVQWAKHTTLCCRGGT
ncbi:hypothetical protein DH2020_035438 [Rehmannia glutinosa]|uniref:Uncharacterized protein n=1 Tax=Rehmannia glutinosa TaxID=99300 RepID=A0ABR0V8P9_REHGL